MLSCSPTRLQPRGSGEHVAAEGSVSTVRTATHCWNQSAGVTGNTGLHLTHGLAATSRGRTQNAPGRDPGRSIHQRDKMSPRSLRPQVFSPLCTPAPLRLALVTVNASPYNTLRSGRWARIGSPSDLHTRLLASRSTLNSHRHILCFSAAH